MHALAVAVALWLPPCDLLVGAAAERLPATDDMVIGGGVLPQTVAGEEAPLRAVAVVVERPGAGKLVLVGLDVLMMARDLLDPVAEEVAAACGVPVGHVLLHCTHTHHAPSTATLHGYARDERFCRGVQRAAVAAARAADAARVPARLHFRVGEESSVGQNSRLLLGDGSIFWVGPRTDAVRPTGPFDPELPVFAFRRADGRTVATVFNHSTHTIGGRRPGVRSPGFYGLAAQELEREAGGVCLFLQGASGSTHNLQLPAGEAVFRVKGAVADAAQRATPRPVAGVVGVRRAFPFRVRRFDEAAEDAAVTAYCARRAPAQATAFADVFRRQRAVLAPRQGAEQTTVVQAVRVGDVAVVGVPAELFTALGQEIKRRSPFRYTYVAELSNDWVGYLPDREAFRLGGYQTWAGLHSYAEPGTGERLVDFATGLLHELADTPVSRP